MKDMKIEVMIFGYFPGKNLPDQYTAIRYLRCMRNDEINSFYHPNSSEARSFINNPFDILIDINFENNCSPPVCHITIQSQIKSGLYDPDLKNQASDLMMELKNPVDIDSYL